MEAWPAAKGCGEFVVRGRWCGKVPWKERLAPRLVGLELWWCRSAVVDHGVGW